MAGFDPYRLWIEFQVKDKTAESLENIRRSVKATKEQTASLKRELASIRAANTVPASALQARQQMLRLAREEATVGEKLATTATRKERQALTTRLQALRIAQRDMSVTRQTLAFQEAQGAAADKAVAANAEVLAIAKNLDEIRAHGIAQDADITDIRREQLNLAREEAAIREQLATTVDLSERAVLQSRIDALALARRELSVRRQTLTVDKADQRARLEAAAGVGHSINRAGTTTMFTGGGVLGGLAYATQQAINFNQSALEADLALGGYQRSPQQRSKDIDALKRAAMMGSEATGFFSAADIMQGLKAVASSGARPLVQKYGMGFFTDIAPALSQYMDVIGRLKGEDAQTAATEAIQLAHMSGSYTAKDIARSLNASAALSLAMPDSMAKAVSTLSYAMPTGKYLAGLSTEATMALLATADQSGLGRGRAGARLKDYIEALTVHQSAAREKAKTKLGLSAALDKNGNLDLKKSFDILIADRQRLGVQAYRDLTRTAFGAQGNVVAAMFGDASKTSMYQANASVISDAVQRGDLKTIQDLLKFNTAGKEAQSLARLKNDIIEFGQYGIPIATKFFDTINPKLKEFGDWMAAHPQDAQNLFDGLLKVGEAFVVLGGAAKLLGFGLGVPLAVLKTIQTYKMAKDLGTLAKSIKTLGVVEGAVEPEAAALASVGTISAGTVAAVSGIIAAVGGLLYGAKINSDLKLPSPTGQGWETDATLSNYGLGYAAPTYSPTNPGKTKADLSALQAKVEFVLPRAVPKGTHVRVDLRHIQGTHPIDFTVPRPATVGGLSFGKP